MMFENSLRIAKHCQAKAATAAASKKDKRRLAISPTPSSRTN